METGLGKCHNVSHHPTKKRIFHLQILEGDVKPIPKKGHLPTPGKFIKKNNPNCELITNEADRDHPFVV